MTIRLPRKKSRQQAQDFRRFQQSDFRGGQNSDSPASKIALNEVALLKNAVSCGNYLEGHYGIQLNSDERWPGSGDAHSMEQHAVTGRWLLHRGASLYLSEGREQNKWSGVGVIGPDGSLTATGTFTDGSGVVTGAAATYLSGMVLAGLTPGQVLSANIVDAGSGYYAVEVYSGVVLVARGTTTISPTTLTLAEEGGSGISGDVDVADLTAVTLPKNGTFTAATFAVTFDLRGLTEDNTDFYTLYWKVVFTVGGTAYTLTLYKDAAKTQAVAQAVGTGSALEAMVTPLNNSAISGTVEFSSLATVDGTYNGSDIQFSFDGNSLVAPSSITSYGDSTFIVWLRGANPKTIYVEQKLAKLWYLSEINGYGPDKISDQDFGTGFDYRILYTLSRIVDPITKAPAYSSNRVTGLLQLEGPSNIAPVPDTDYTSISTNAPISVSDSIEIPLKTSDDVPIGLNAAAYITHISLYRTRTLSDPTTIPDQYIWIADVPIYDTTYTDSTEDAVLLARIEAGSTAAIPYIYALPSRGWREMDKGVGAIRVDFMFTAFPDSASSSYCDVQVIPRLIGYHNPQQRILLKDPVTHLTTTRELMVVVCPSSAYALTTGINQDVGGGLYYIPIITNFERISGNVGVASRYNLFRVDESSFLAYCTDHTIRIFSAMSWGKPIDGSNVHKILERALGDAKIGFIRGVVFFWFMDGTRKRCLRYGSGENTGIQWSELERTGWIYPVLVATQETDESLLKLTTLGADDGVFYAIENEAPDRIYEDEVAEDWPVLRGAGADALSDLVIDDWNGVELYGRMLGGRFKLYESQADADADANVMGMSAVIAAPTDDVEFSGVVNGVVNVLAVANTTFTVINGVHIGSYAQIISPVKFRDLTATVEAFICTHQESHVYMRFPYGKPAPLVAARWYANGIVADESTQVPESGDIQSYKDVQGRRIQLELEMQSSGWQITAADTEYQTQDIRSIHGPWDSNEAATQKEIASDMLSWVNNASGVLNRADTRIPKQPYVGTAPTLTDGPYVGKYAQDFSAVMEFVTSRDVTAYTLMFWGRGSTGTPVAINQSGSPAAFISFPDANTIDIGSFQFPLTSPANDGLWHHYAVTRDADWFRVYQDGIQIGQALLSPGTTIAASAFTLGPGQMFDPRTYSKALTAVAVKYYVDHPEQVP